MITTCEPQIEVIEAAGGLIWRTTPQGDEIAVIYRDRYDDWTLPKGKRQVGESWTDTALREVYEETGCQVEIKGFAGGHVYTVNGLPKIVLFWHMRLLADPGFIPNEEVDRLIWLSPAQAIQTMSYESEKVLLR